MNNSPKAASEWSPVNRPEDDITKMPDGDPEESPDGHGAGVKLPPPKLTGFADIDKRLLSAWADHMSNGFKNNQIMFERLLKAFVIPYYATVAMYIVLFVIGIGLFIAGSIISISQGQLVIGLLFGGLAVGLFLLFFVSQPLRALEQNQAFITWLGACYNTYWTRLMYVQNRDTATDELKKIGDDFVNDLQKLIQVQAKYSAQRPGTQQLEKSKE